MASIRERKTSSGKTIYRVQVRLSGFTPQYGTFTSKKTAEQWAERLESKLRQLRFSMNVHASVSALIRHDLLDGRRMTNLDIADDYRTPNGSSRIHALRKHGLPIQSERIPGLKSGKVEYFIPPDLLPEQRKRFGLK